MELRRHLLLGTLVLGNFPTGGSIGSAASTVDLYASIDIAQTTATQTLTIPNPTNVITGSRLIIISNTGSVSFILLGVNVKQDKSILIKWDATAWSVIGDEGSDADWYMEGSTTDAGANTDNAYHLGQIAVGQNTVTNRLDVTEGVRTGTHSTGLPGYFTGTGSSLTDFNNNDVATPTPLIEVRQLDSTEGIGITKDGIVSVGTLASPNVNLNITPKGRGNVVLNFSSTTPTGDFDMKQFASLANFNAINRNVYFGSTPTLFAQEVFELKGNATTSPTDYHLRLRSGGSVADRFVVQGLTGDLTISGYPNTRNDTGSPINILTTDATGLLQSHSVAEIVGSSTDFWLDTTGTLPNGTTDNTEEIHREGRITVGAGNNSETASTLRVGVISGQTLNTVFDNADSGFSLSNVGIRTANGTFASPTATSGSAIASTLFFGGHNGTAWTSYNNSPQISLFTRQTWASGAHGGALLFSVIATNSTTPVAKMIIDSTGHVGINNTNPVASLDVDGAEIFRTINIADISSNGSIGSAATTVDIASTIRLNQTTTGITLTIAAPSNSQSGRRLLLLNKGTADVTITTAAGNKLLLALESFYLTWDGSGSSGWHPLVINGAGGSDASYTHNQGTPSTTWSITHGLGKFPSVTIVDSGGTVYYGEINHIDANSLTVSFSSAFGGKAYLN